MGSAARRTVSGVPPDHDVHACPICLSHVASCNTNTSSSALFLGYSTLLITALLLSSPKTFFDSIFFHRHAALLLKNIKMLSKIFFGLAAVSAVMASPIVPDIDFTPDTLQEAQDLLKFLQDVDAQSE